MCISDTPRNGRKTGISDIFDRFPGSKCVVSGRLGQKITIFDTFFDLKVSDFGTKSGKVSNFWSKSRVKTRAFGRRVQNEPKWVKKCQKLTDFQTTVGKIGTYSPCSRTKLINDVP